MEGVDSRREWRQSDFAGDDASHTVTAGRIFFLLRPEKVSLGRFALLRQSFSRPSWSHQRPLSLKHLLPRSLSPRRPSYSRSGSV